MIAVRDTTDPNTGSLRTQRPIALSMALGALAALIITAIPTTDSALSLLASVTGLIVAAAVTLRARRIDQLPLLLGVAYMVGLFSIRPALLLWRPSLYRPHLPLPSISAASILHTQLVLVLFMMSFGVAFSWGLSRVQTIFLSSRSHHPVGKVRTSVLAILLGAAISVSAVLLASLGGPVQALARSKVIRAELVGSFTLPVALWFLAGGGLVAHRISAGVMVARRFQLGLPA